MKPRRGARLRACAAALLVLACTPAAAALQLRFDDAGLTPPQAAASRELLDAVVRRLPPGLGASPGGPVTVSWRDDLPERVHGRARGRHVLLRRRLLQDWIVRPPGDAGEAATRAAMAAVVHELAHVHDRAQLGGLSRDPRLLDLAGWQVRPLRLGFRGGHNAFTGRSPDAYELRSPAEFVAVNLEHFVLDPDYGCRRPALHRYFTARLGMAPLPAAPCAAGVPFVAPAAGEAALLQLDPARVYAVDYLLAEANDQPMSRWGHSMLRLVVCAPGRPPGPDCRFDLQHHRVLSFRAFVDDVQVSSWRGLTGSYPSRLYVLPLQQVVDEYTKVELRGLQSIPLALGRDEIAALLERAARVHWSYDGRYYFLGNNCAVETFKLLHDGVPRLAGERLASITPTGLLRRLRRAGVADTSVLDDAATARRLGFYFEPASARYQAMFEVARAALGLPQARVEAWLALPPRERAPWLARADLRGSAALLLLEEAAQRREELRARDELKHLLLHDERAGGEAPAAAVRALLRLEGGLARPAALLPPGGYGLPQPAERASAARAADDLAARLRTREQALRREARGWLGAARRGALEAIDANLSLLGERLRQLHRQQQGVRIDALVPAEALP